MSTTEIQAMYRKLWGQAVQAIETNLVRNDPNLLNKVGDLRRGLTLICRPSTHVQSTVMDFLEEAHSIEPDQYFYKPTELHTTVLGIITCHEDFRLCDINITPYVETFRESIASICSFHIEYREQRD